MLGRLRKFLSPEVKERIMNSLPYRILERIKLKNHKINFSCELTTKCNAFCDMCTRSFLIKNKKLEIKDMSEEIIKRVLEEMEKFYKNGKKIYFSPMGLGEPLLFPGLFVLFRKIKKISKNIEIVLVTNGILLDKNKARKLISLGVDEITISLNTNNAKDYKKHMKIGMYDRIIKNIETLIKLRNQSKRKIPRVFIQYLNYGNKDFVSDIKKWAEIMKYDDKCYVHSVANQAGFFNGKSTILNKESYPCTQPLWRIAIKINGSLYPCDPCFYSGKQKIHALYLGNIKTTNLFEQFFSKNNKQARIIKSMRKNQYSKLPECKKCNTYKLASNPFFQIPKFMRFFSYKWI